VACRGPAATAATGTCGPALNFHLHSSVNFHLHFELLLQLTSVALPSSCPFSLLLLQGTMDECRAAYQAAAEWFAFWRRGDVVEGEAALIAEKASQRPAACLRCCCSPCWHLAAQSIASLQALSWLADGA
jgi:hypothetical protein